LQEDFGTVWAFAGGERTGDPAGGHGSAFRGAVFAEGPAFTGPGTDEALRVSRSAEGSPEFHDGLVVVAGMPWVNERLGELVYLAADGGF